MGIADCENGLIYLGCGQWGNAGISALGIVPYLGDIGKGGKYGAKGYHAMKGGNRVAKQQLDAVARELGMNKIQRKEFGKYLDKRKSQLGDGGNKHK